MKVRIAVLLAAVLATGMAGCMSDDYGDRDHGGYGHDHQGRDHDGGDQDQRGDHGGGDGQYR